MIRPTFGGAGETRPLGRFLRRDCGMVVLEAALVIPLLMAVSLAGLCVARTAIDEVAVVGAARDGALAAGRGAAEAEVVADVRRRLPDAAVLVTWDPTSVTVQVRRHASVIPGFGRLSVDHQAASVAPRERGGW